MSKFTHYDAAVKTAYYSYRTKLREMLGIKRRHEGHVMKAGMDYAVKRYERICRTLLDHMPDPSSLRGAVASEIGCGDCLASADMMLGLGARHVHLVEFSPLTLTEGSRSAIEILAAKEDLPNDGKLLAPGDPVRLDPERVSYHQGLLENIRLPEKVDFLYSFDVLEHVEDLEGFFSYCGEVVKPGGTMVHKFDLTGHNLFEDPMPPLDFQTFPTWLFNLIFPKYRRAVGNFADEFLEVIERHGFIDLKVIPIRVAEDDYLEQIWPHLRAKARKRSKDIVKLLDLVVVATKRE